MRRIIFLLSIVAFAVAEKTNYRNYKVFRITPKTEKQLEQLRKLDGLSEGYSFWREPSRPGHPVDLMVAPELQAEFAALMNRTSAALKTYVEDVEQLIEQENPPTREAGFGWTRYHRLDEIYSWLDSLAQLYSGRVQVLSPGRTSQGREIRGVKLSFGSEEKPAVFIEGGIHAREWIAPATVTFIIDQLLNSQEPQVRALAEAYDWYLFPSFNPDGYVYSHTQNRLWRKTMSKSSMFCRGTDPNRNWGYKWNTAGGASSNPCSESYAGKSAFSEIETRTMSQFIKSIADKLFAYVAFHSYSQLLLFPYGHTEKHLDNYDESHAMGVKAIDALARRYGTKYVTGNVAETIYVATGGSMDWVKATLKVPVVFTYELRDTGKHGFILPADQIIPNGQEVLDSLVALFKQANKFGYPKSEQ